MAITGGGQSSEDVTRVRAETTVKAIVELRKRLLDLSNRNRLLNYKHRETARQVRLIANSLDSIHAALSSEMKLRFIGLPKDDETADDIRLDQELTRARLTDERYLTAIGHNVDDSDAIVDAAEEELRDRTRAELGLRLSRQEKRTQEQIAKALGIPPAFDLPLTGAESNVLQTLLFNDTLERKLSSIRDESISSLQERGVNTLYCALGFLEWYESDDSAKVILSPLMLFPIGIERHVEHSKYVYSAKGLGEDVETNVTLTERLYADFQLSMPALGPDEPITAYFERLELAIASHKRWKIRTFATVGLFDFTRLAMYKDLDPERRSEADALEKHEAILNLLGGMLERTRSGSGEAWSDDVHSPQAPLLITDADSSQFAAILESLNGKSFVIEGPPGTGKSQTITNVIAALLSAKKRVLFVADKLAALEVVKNRLDAAGLGDFCMELHSTKLLKTEVYASIKRRLALTTGSEPAKDTLPRIERAKQTVNDYTTAIHGAFGELRRPIHDLIWREQVLRLEIGDSVQALHGRQIRSAKSITELKLEELTKLVSSISERHQTYEQLYGSAMLHPLSAIRATTLKQDDVSELREALELISGFALRLPVLLAELGATLGDASPGFNIASVLVSVADEIAKVSPTPRAGDVDRAATVCDVDEVLSLARLLKHSATARTAWEATLYESVLTSQKPLDDLLARFDDAYDADFATLQVDVQIHKEEHDRIVDANAVIATTAESLGHPVSDDRSMLDCLVRVASLLRNEDGVVHPFFDATILSSPATKTVESHRSRAEAVRERRTALLSVFDISLVTDTQEARKHAASLRAANPLTALFSADVRDAKRFYRRIALQKTSSGREAMAGAMVDLAETLEQQTAFDTDRELEKQYGTLFSGLQTDFDALTERAHLAAGIRDVLAQHGQAGTKLQLTLKDLAPDQVAALRVLAMSDELDDLADFAESVPEKQSIRAEVARRKRLVAGSSNALSAWAKLPIPSDMTIERLRAMRDEIIEACALRERRKQNSESIAMISDCDDLPALESETAALEVRHIIKNAGAESLFSHISGITLLQSELWDELRTMLSEIEEAFAVLRQVKVDLDALVRGSIAESSADEIRDAVEAMLDHLNELPDWLQFMRGHRAAKAAGVADVLSASLEADIPAGKAIEYVLVRSLILDALDESAELSDAAGNEFTKAREDFQTLDRRLLDENRKRLRNELLRRFVDQGNRVGNRGAWTGMALIENEAGKRSRHVSLRDLHRRSGRALQQLKPCYMMSPLSVSQLIEPGSMQFDVLIIDEASQMRPEDALGAVSRADQIVIVGDPKQLPPTAFFDRSDVSDEVSDEDAVETESILDLAMQQYGRPRRLLWHYRSRHDSLIAFSNKQFYDGDLQIFPSPDRSGDLGVRYTYVGGHYQGSVNPIEANRIADRAIEIMKTDYTKSLGIVAMNQRQRDLIRLEVERRVLLDRKAQDYIARWEERLEPFIIKNLESIQGDERDIVIVSTVYGPDPSGNMYQRFGPINSKNGWRRLNVLFTRAKYRVEVISSMRPSDIVSDERTGRGVRAFREYLDYAASGRLETGSHTGRPPDSDFEVAVAQMLAERGFSCEPQVGVAGFFIDIGVRDPNNSGRFILGVECDGSTYHSTKAARDRDRLRDEVLVRLGWRLHRVWSTDWFADPVREMDRLVTSIHENAVGVPPAADDAPSDFSTVETHQSAPREATPRFRQQPDRPAVAETLFSESDLLEALRAVLPAGSSLEREKLLRGLAARFGQPLSQKVRSAFNRMISQEVRQGRLSVDASWSVVRRP